MALCVASSSACLSIASPPPRQLAVQASVAAPSSISPFSSTSQLLVNSSIDAFATKSSARQYFSAGASSLESVASISSLFLVAALSESVSTSVTPSRTGALLLFFSVPNRSFCEAVEYGTGPVYQTGEALKCTRCRMRLDTAWLQSFTLNRESTQPA